MQATHKPPSPPAPVAFDAGSVLDSLPHAVWLLDAAGNVQFRNEAAQLRFPQALQLEGVLLDARVLEPFDGWQSELERAFTLGQAARRECVRLQQPEGIFFFVTVWIAPFRAARGGPVTGVLAVAEETNRVDEGAERIEVSHRLASLGKLAARVAHELNNPLDGILRYINLALRIVGSNSEDRLRTYLHESRTGLMRVVQIITELLAYSRETDGEFDEIDINGTLEQSIRVNTAAADAARVVITADLQGQGMPAIRGSRLYQVCCNLIRNALDAMPEGGRLTISSGIVDEHVVIRIADTGVGLSAVRDRLFEPFVTTKPAGKGTGLGLAICKDYIEQMRGTISASDGEPRGAVFTVKIPLASCVAQPRLAAPTITDPT